MPSALNYGVGAGDYDAAAAMVQYTDMYGGVPLSLNVANPHVFWCPSDLDPADALINGVVQTNSYSSYRYRFVIWNNTCMYPGLKTSDFVKPVGQIVYHENTDNHYKHLTASYTPIQPKLNAIYADFHAAPWLVLFQQNVDPADNCYDPNWFTYALPGPRFNTGEPNIGGDVHTGFDF